RCRPSGLDRGAALPHSPRPLVPSLSDCQVLAPSRRAIFAGIAVLAGVGVQTMKRHYWVGVLLLCGSGCTTMSNTGAGAIGGGIIGGTLGTVAGLACGRPLAGAAIGAGAGAGIGALAGCAEDKREARQQAAVNAAVAQSQQVVTGPVGLWEIASMAQ